MRSTSLQHAALGQPHADERYLSKDIPDLKPAKRPKRPKMPPYEPRARIGISLSFPNLFGMGGIQGKETASILASKTPRVYASSISVFVDLPLGSSRFAESHFRIFADIMKFRSEQKEVPLRDVEKLFGNEVSDFVDDLATRFGPFIGGDDLDVALDSNLTNAVITEGRAIKLGGMWLAETRPLFLDKGQSIGLSFFEFGLGGFAYLGKWKQGVYTHLKDPAKKEGAAKQTSTFSGEDAPEASRAPSKVISPNNGFFVYGGGLTMQIAPIALYVRGPKRGGRFEPVVVEAAGMFLFAGKEGIFQAVYGHAAVRTAITIDF